MYEKSLIILKPDSIQRNLTGTIITRFENAGFKIHAAKLVQASPELSKKHYSEHAEKDFYPNIENYITSGPVLVLVIGGLGAISRIRTMVGATEPASAAPGTIRGDFAHQVYPAKDDLTTPIRNLIHASASVEEAAQETAIWFDASEIIEYSKENDGTTNL